MKRSVTVPKPFCCLLAAFRSFITSVTPCYHVLFFSLCIYYEDNLHCSFVSRISQLKFYNAHSTMSSTSKTPRGFSYVEDVEFYFETQISDAKAELERYDTEILAYGLSKELLFDPSQSRLERVDYIQRYELIDCENLLDKIGKERHDVVYRRKERMRILRLEIKDLAGMKEREVCRFKESEGVYRKVLNSYEDITNFYSSRLTELADQITIWKEMDNNERRLPSYRYSTVSDLILEEKNLRAEMEREKALGKAKGWVYVFSGVGTGEGATGVGGRKGKLPTI
jgi:hypothetical protein